MVERGLMPGKVEPRLTDEASINRALLPGKKTIATADLFDILTSLFAGNGKGETALIFAFE
jgi:hypothetical protein